ncbi:leucine-rich repeat domain-containing protein [candidate division KSB1 bacterium]|nr:leucine-rich repeat domain-containing protein [candidate division KSB1 bacterium]
MSILFVVIYLLLCIFFIIGLIKPELVIKWGKKKNRKIVILIFISGIIIDSYLINIYDMKNIKKALKNPDNVTSLDLSYKQKAALSDDFKNKFRSNEFKILNELDLSYNNFTEFPKDITNCASLRILCLNENNIHKLPAEFSNLENLEELDLSANDLNHFPKIVIKCKSIRVLNLNNNNISTIPFSLQNLENLQILKLDNNPIIIPEWLTEMKALKELSIAGIKLTSLPNNILDLYESGHLKINFEQTTSQMPAVKRRTTQAGQAKLAVDGKNYSVRLAAVEKLIDPTVLAKIALKAKDQAIRESVIEKLINPALLETFANEKEDYDVQIIYKLIHSFDAVPQEHRKRLISKILLAIHVLNDPEVKNEVGEIVSIKTSWSDNRQSYKTNSGIRSFPGESFQCSIKLKHLTGPLSNSWESYFPEITTGSYLSFNEAEVNGADLLGLILDRLSQSQLTRILMGSRDWQVHSAIFDRLNDQTMLSKIAMEDADAWNRRNATKKLTDQTVLEKIAVEDKDLDVRFTAVSKLNDHILLAKLATKDRISGVRVIALERLTDQALIAKIAVNDGDWYVRMKAVNCMNDRTLLAKISKDDGVTKVREAAQKRLEALREELPTSL